jgi:hypothetical protein
MLANNVLHLSKLNTGLIKASEQIPDEESHICPASLLPCQTKNEHTTSSVLLNPPSPLTRSFSNTLLFLLRFAIGIFFFYPR